MNSQQLTTIKLPIPRQTITSNGKLSEMMLPTNWPTGNSQFQTPLPSTHQVVTCQPMLTNSSIVKPTPNKRGRKPLARMPETKKHIQNLTNQRAFRKRRENYIRALETKANNFETCYNEARNEIKMLRERLKLLEDRISKPHNQGSNNDKCGINVSPNTTVYRQIDESHESIPYESQNNDNNPSVVMSNDTYDNRNLSLISPSTMSSFSFNEQRYQHQLISDDKGSPPKPVDPIDDIMRNPVFCETRDGDICFCESFNGLNIDELEKDQTNFSSVGRYIINHKCGKRMWIIKGAAAQCATPTSSFSNITTCNDSSRECIPPLPSPPEHSGSQWSSQQQQERYFSPSPSPMTTQHHPLNLKWILDENHNEENSDDSI